MLVIVHNIFLTMAHYQKSLKTTASSHLTFPQTQWVQSGSWEERKWQSPQELKSHIIFTCWKMAKNAKKKKGMGRQP